MTMVDTNVLVDLRERDPRWYGWSFETLKAALASSTVSVSAIVVGELASRDEPSSDVISLLEGLGLTIEPLPIAAALVAGQAHRDYRAAGGRRVSLLGDFLIGGHAEAVGVPLITRDDQRYRRDFPKVALITPETHPDG